MSLAPDVLMGTIQRDREQCFPRIVVNGLSQCVTGGMCGEPEIWECEILVAGNLSEARGGE